MTRKQRIAPDKYRDGVWLQRYYVDGKYTWSVSGVLWNNIKERCKPLGHTQLSEPTYVGAENRFNSFCEFVEWNKEQIGYAMGYDLDADILKNENKYYSKETCLLIPPALNRFIQGRGKNTEKTLPRGLSLVDGRIWVRLTIKDDLTGKVLSLVNQKLPVNNVDEAKLLYRKALSKSVDIWIDRLVFSGRYCVDDKVIDYLLKTKNKIDYEGFTW